MGLFFNLPGCFFSGLADFKEEWGTQNQGKRPLFNMYDCDPPLRALPEKCRITLKIVTTNDYVACNDKFQE